MVLRLHTAARRPPNAREVARVVLVGLLVLVLAVALLWRTGAERRAIEGMAPAERRAVYEQAFGELQRLCGSGPRDDALERRCREQIRFVLQFPECDATCQAIARRHEPLPTK